MKLPHITATDSISKPFKRMNAFWIGAAIVAVVGLILFWRRRNR